MKVSFIVPIYNADRYLKRCIDAILTQKGCDFEVVLVDDGSTDDSGSICDEYAISFPKIIRVLHKSNEGSLLARRSGFAEATGDWIICVDADDLVAPDLLQAVTETVCTYNCDMVLYDYSKVYPDGSCRKVSLNLPTMTRIEGDEKKKVYQLRLLGGELNFITTKAFKRELLDWETDYKSIGIRKMSDDAVQVLPLLTNAQSIVYVNQTLYYYHKGVAGSITVAMNYDNWHALFECFSITEDYLLWWNIDQDTRVRYYSRYAEVLCNYIRWLYKAENSELPYDKKELLLEVKDKHYYKAISQQYRRKYLSTSYSAFSVPIIMKLAGFTKQGLLKLYLFLENGLMKWKSL